MMRMRAWALSALGASLALLCVCALTVYVLDPYAHYHTVTLPLTDNPGYAAPGIARHYDYDTVLVGSSMVENMKPSQIDACLGGQSIKIAMRGGTAADHARVLDLCFDTHALSRVIYCMDPTSFTARAGNVAHEYPSYLWNGAGLDDVQYLLNGSVLLDKTKAARRYERLLSGYATDRDAMYVWTDVTFSRENAMRSYDWHAQRYEMKPADYFADRFAANLDQCVIPFVRAHPETAFTFYFPPYSVIYWILQSDAGNLEAQLWIREQFASVLLSYENVTVYDFAACTPWILDLDRYMDYSHHDARMNAQIIDAMADGTHRISSVEEISAANDVIRREVAAFERPQ